MHKIKSLGPLNFSTDYFFCGEPAILGSKRRTPDAFQVKTVETRDSVLAVCWERGDAWRIMAQSMGGRITSQKAWEGGSRHKAWEGGSRHKAWEGGSWHKAWEGGSRHKAWEGGSRHKAWEGGSQNSLTLSAQVQEGYSSRLSLSVLMLSIKLFVVLKEAIL